MRSSKVTVVVGGQFGDEGKGKFVHYLVHKDDYDIVGRGNGGPNAGHNVHDSERGIHIALHLMPSGVISKTAVNIVGCGTVINPHTFIEEMDSVAKAGVALSPEKLKLSSRAHIILQSHRVIDSAGDKVGSTGQGIGPTYRDKAVRTGLRLESILRETFLEDARDVLETHNRELSASGHGDLCLDVERELVRLAESADVLRPYITDTVEYISGAIHDGKSILAEGAQATLLDINYGTYPFVTSSGCTASGILGGLGVPAHYVNRVIGVFKLPMTRVGKGPFVTLLADDEADLHAKLAGKKGSAGSEFGATTGRARDIGWMDLVAAKYAHAVNGFTEIGLTKLDALSGIKKLKVATAYECNGEKYSAMPADTKTLETCSPVYTELPGWEENIDGQTDYESLPQAAKDYVAFIEEQIGVPVTMIGTGPNNSDIIVRKNH